MTPPRRPLIFDVETIADLTPETRDTVAALAAGREMTPEAYGGLCPPLARVVCIGWLDAAQQALGTFLDATLCPVTPPASVAVEHGAAAAPVSRDCAMIACNGEAEVLRQFGRMVDAHCRSAGGQLVTYSGRGFDLPVLIHRAIKHQVTEGRELLIRAATENRYRPVLHLDLVDAVTFFGASNRWPLAAYAVGYGCRSPKTDMDGSQVWAAVQAGRLVDVARYCAGDVLATAHIHRCLQSPAPLPSAAAPVER
jgi:hypothetical protein